MFSFFRSSLPSRILFIVFLAIIAFFLNINYYTEQTLNQFHVYLLSEKIIEGKILYLNVYDYLAPIPVYFNAILIYLGGNSKSINQFFGFAIIIFNSLYFNNIVYKYRLIEERSHIPGLMYLLFSCSIYSGFELSPVLIASGFLTLTISSLLKIGLENSDKIKYSFHSGIYLGLAFLSDQSMIFFLLMGLVATFYYSTKVLKTFGLLLLGFTFPFLILLNIYLYNHNQNSLFKYLISSYFTGDALFNLDLSTLIPWLAISFFFLLLYFPTKLRSSFTNYISKGHQLMVIWMILSFLIIFFIKELSYSIIHIFTLPFSFLTSFYLINLRKKRVAEFFTIVIIAFVFSFNYLDILKNKKHGILEKNKVDLKMQGTTLLLANNLNFYSVNSHSSAFTNWELEKKSFLNISNSANLAKVYLGITDDYPTYILDPDGIFERIMTLVPLFREKYTKIDDKTYQLN